MKKKQIFISSTYVDLISHRKFVWNLLKSFNVDISGMEKFGARTEVALKTCLKEVEESDIFIGILGMRYGSIDKKSGKSFSQLEYEKALEEKKDILIYLMDKDKSKVIPNQIDFKNYLKLEEFKNVVSNNHTIDKFNSENNLVEKINNDLKKILSEDSVIQNFRPEIINAEQYNAKINGENWLIVLGLKFGKPFEIYIGKRKDAFNIPRITKESKIAKRIDSKGNIRFDFQYRDSDGYKTTIEGLSRFHSNLMVLLASKLLEKDVPINKIVEILSEVNFESGETDKEIKKIIIEILSNIKNTD